MDVDSVSFISNIFFVQCMFLFSFMLTAKGIYHLWMWTEGVIPHKGNTELFVKANFTRGTSQVLYIVSYHKKTTKNKEY